MTRLISMFRPYKGRVLVRLDAAPSPLLPRMVA
jgi:hypothetical protein